jgi:hypothetical protein
MRFRESLESSYQNPGKRRKVEARQEAVQAKEQGKFGNKEQADMAS